MSTDKTLADVQPGGRVRLGDQAERARFEEWYVQNAFDYEANPIGSRDCALQWKAWQAGRAPMLESMWVEIRREGDQTFPRVMERSHAEAFLRTCNVGPIPTIQPLYAALSAQPSPGGQGDALTALVAKWRAAAAEHELNGLEADSIGLTVAAMRNDARHHVLEAAADELEAALAARQPVESEENVAADTYWTLAEMIEPHVQREGINPDGALPASVHDSVAILLEHWLRTRQPVGEIVGWQHCADNYSHMVISDSNKAALKEGETEEGIRKIDAAYSIPLVRQPVGEPVGHLFRVVASDEGAAQPWKGRNIIYTEGPAPVEGRSGFGQYMNVYAAPPAQAVDLGSSGRL